MRSLKIVRLSSVHGSGTIRELYAGQQSLASMSYTEQLRRVLELRVHYSDAFERAMRSLGHEALGIICDIEPMQRAWAREEGLDWDKEGADGIVIAQLKKWKPDVLYLQDIFTLPTAIRKEIKSLVPSIRAVVLFKGSPGAMEEAAGFDLVFAATPHLTRSFGALGLNAQLLYHAFDAQILSTRPFTAEPLRRNLPATFAGSSGYGWGLGFQARYWLLRRLFEELSEFEAWVDERQGEAGWRTGLWNAAKRCAEVLPDVWVREAAGFPAMPAVLARVARETLFEKQALRSARQTFPEEKIFAKPRIPDRPLRRLFAGRCHEPVFGLGLFEILSRSLVTANRHADAVAGEAGNIRLFEATGMGACLVTEKARNIADLFEPEKEVVTYRSAEECVDKIRYLLRHPDEASGIAAAGHARTLRDHTTLNRCRIIAGEIQKLL